MGMKYKDPTTGNFKEINVKVADTLPVGSEVDYNGATIPTGWEEVDSPNDYSTEEVKIGTWIDGKPLYRRVLSLTTPSTIYNTKRANFDKTFIIKNYYGNVFMSDTNQLLPINFYFTDEYNIATYIVNKSGEIYMKVGTEHYENQQATLTIEYTKTTD